MAKYSDHSTIGGQVLAHRIRMIKQNANIIFNAGKIGFLVGYIATLFVKFNGYELWNFLCIVKAEYFRKFPFLTVPQLEMNGDKQWM